MELNYLQNAQEVMEVGRACSAWLVESWADRILKISDKDCLNMSKSPNMNIKAKKFSQYLINF